MAKDNEKLISRLLDREQTVRSLKKENRILKAEIKRLSRIIDADSIARVSDASDVERVWSVKEKEVTLLSSSTYAKYLVSKITGGSLFAFSKKAMGYFRKFRLVSTVMRVISSALAVIGTGAFFIFLSGTLVFIIPFITVFCILIYFLGTAWRKQAFRALERSISKRQIFVILPSRSACFYKSQAFENTLKIISNDTQNDNFTIIVSPYVFSSVGLSESGGGFYPIARYEKDNVCLLRKHSFFLLRKRILSLSEDRTTYIY